VYYCIQQSTELLQMLNCMRDGTSRLLYNKVITRSLYIIANDPAIERIAIDLSRKKREGGREGGRDND